jgi:hypothetical protein
MHLKSCSFSLILSIAPAGTSRSRFSSGADDRVQVLVDSVFVCRTHSMSEPRIDFQLCVSNNLGGLMGHGADRNNLVVIAVQDERWHIELREVFCEVRLGESFDAIQGSRESTQHTLQPEGVASLVRPLRRAGSHHKTVEIFKELRSVREHAGANFIERFYR